MPQPRRQIDPVDAGLAVCLTVTDGVEKALEVTGLDTKSLYRVLHAAHAFGWLRREAHGKWRLTGLWKVDMRHRRIPVWKEVARLANLTDYAPIRSW